MSAERDLQREDREWLIQQPQFQRTLFEIYRQSGITRFTRDEHQSLFQEGKRSLGLEILGWFSATPAEPDDVIASVIAAKNQVTPPKGARKHDDRDPYQ